MRRIGASPTAVKSMLSTIQKAKHHIVTAFGPSTQHYGEHRYPPLQGLGQGNGSAPAGWTAVSTPIINMMRKQILASIFSRQYQSHHYPLYAMHSLMIQTLSIVKTQNPQTVISLTKCKKQ